MTNLGIVVPISCPYCGATLDDATQMGAEQAQPSEGDITVCLYCTGVMLYDVHLKPVVLTDEARKGISEENWADINRVAAAIRKGRGGDNA